MRPFALFIAVLLAGSLAAQTFPGFSPLVDLIKPNPIINGNGPGVMTIDATGDVYFAARTLGDLPGAQKIGTSFAPGDLLIVKTDARLEQVRFMTVIAGGGDDGNYGVQPSAIRVDAAGNIYVVGIAFPTNFPYTNILSSANGAAFLLKVSATGDKLIYASRLGQFQVSALDMDATGAAYVGSPSNAGPVVQKVSPAGDTLVYQKYVGTDSSAVVEGISARPDGTAVFLTGKTLGALNAAGSGLEFAVPMSLSTGSSLGVDAAGNLYVNSGWGLNSDLVAKYSSSGVLLDTRRLPVPVLMDGDRKMLVSADGTVYLLGNTDGASFPTRNALELCTPNLKPPYGTAGSSTTAEQGYGLVVYNSQGALQYASSIAGSNPANVMALSSDGRYLYRSSAHRRYDTTPTSWAGMERIDLSRILTANKLSPSCLAHGATYFSAPISPGGIMTLYGSNLGPQTGVSFSLMNGLIPTTLVGTAVTVDNVPAPLLYAQDSQINFIAPWGTKTQGTVEVCITRAADRACLDASAAAVSPAAFRYQSSPIVAHQDGTLNSQTNPAHKGDYVSIYMTGTGTLSGSLIDGGVWGSSLQYITATVGASIAGDRPSCGFTLGCINNPPPAPIYNVDVVYAGSAPFLAQGVSQINFRIPASLPVSGLRYMSVGLTPTGPNVGETVSIWIVP